MRRPLIAVAGVLIAVSPAFAEDATPGVGRYQITPDEEGFTRLDTETGAVSHCAKRDGVWYCEPLAGADRELEERLEALAGEVARVSERLVVLAGRLEALADRLDRTAAPPAAGATAEEETRRAEEALSFAEKLMRRFFEMVREMKDAEADRI